MVARQSSKRPECSSVGRGHVRVRMLVVDAWSVVLSKVVRGSTKPVFFFFVFLRLELSLFCFRMLVGLRIEAHPVAVASLFLAVPRAHA